MKYLITFLFIALSYTSYSQSLANTEWGVYLDGDIEITVRFGEDTFYVQEFPPMEIAFSTYTENLDTFRILDLEGVDGCFESFGDVEGTYTFQIQNDTLTFNLVEDSCDFRVEVLDFGIFVGDVNTSTHDSHDFGEVVLYPNPLENGILNIKSEQELDMISVYDIFGRLLISTSEASSIDLSGFANRLFLVQMKSGNKVITRKIVRRSN